MSGRGVDKAGVSLTGVDPSSQLYSSALRLSCPVSDPSTSANYLQYMRSLGQPNIFPHQSHEMSSGGGLLTNSIPLGVIKQGLGPLNIHRDARQDIIPPAGISGAHTNNVHVVDSVPNVVVTDAAAAANTPAGQRLKVEDALSYLDQVKLQFGSRPQVYSDFLDIMKDFKSQSIDTPGVIQRVSNLFRGHPSLIVGFNTFLPPGYKIQVDGEKGERVSICTPSGTSQIITTSVEKENTTTENGGHVPERPAPNAHPEAPMEFNNAIIYVNKIKSRFSNKPDIYKQFLEILHQYQKEQREIKGGQLPPGHRPLTENQVYAAVAKLFAGEGDLLMEFSQFLPEATNVVTSTGGFLHAMASELNCEVKESPSSPPPKPVKRPAQPSPQSSPPNKKAKKVECHYDISISEASKYGTLEEFQFFDKVRKALKNETVYENFLRCLLLFNQELISKTDLVNVAHPFLSKFPELFVWLKQFMGCCDRVAYQNAVPLPATQQRISSDLAIEIDYASCKRYGVSYRALPASYAQPLCSGRDKLCVQVLNDTWVSFPSWSSEDTSNVSSKKTQFEEFIYRVEDERFELDMVIEANRYAMHTLEVCQRRLNKMATEEARKFSLGADLGGSSQALMLRAIKRIYGDKAPDLVDGLRRNPVVAVPLVLKRLKAKDDEWREAQRSFNQTWREQNQKYYVKSLDHQGLTFKQNDVKQMRAKALVNHIETLYDERQEQQEDTGSPITGPHLQLTYPQDTRLIYDANDLIIHHVKRQTGIQKDEKSRVKRILRHFLPDLFKLDREDLSDDEQDANDSPAQSTTHVNRRRRTRSGADRGLFTTQPIAQDSGRNEDKIWCGYSLMMASSSWYVFIRLHNLLCERLAKLKSRADVLVHDNEQSQGRSKSAAQILKCLPQNVCPPERAYTELVQQVKNLLDGQVEPTQFEDTLRDIFTTDAYLAFTMDRLIHAIVRQLQNIVTDDSSVQLLHLHREWALKGAAGGLAYSSVNRQTMETQYQSTAQQVVNDSNLFKIYMIESGRVVSVELLESDPIEDEHFAMRRTKWSAYMSRFVKDKEGILTSIARKPPFLLRNVACEQNASTSDASPPSDVIVQENLQLNLKPCHYRMRYVPGTEDLLKRRSRPGVQTRTSASVTRRRTRFRDWWSEWTDLHVVV